MKRLNVVLDEELHTKLKITAFEKGVTMSQYIKELLERELNQSVKEEKNNE